MHTLGPWYTKNWTNDGNAIGVFAHVSENPDDPEWVESQWIADVVLDHDHGDKSAEEMVGNARLIAAAPDLLAVCKVFVGHCEKMYRNPGKEDLWFDEIYNSCKHAIAKAEGRNQQ